MTANYSVQLPILVNMKYCRIQRTFFETSCSSSSFTRRKNCLAPSLSPYRPCFSFQTIFPGVILSFGGLIYNSRSSSLPCKNADLMSVVFTTHLLLVIIAKTIRIAPFSTVGLSVGRIYISSKPLTTSLALAVPFFVVISTL